MKFVLKYALSIAVIISALNVYAQDEWRLYQVPTRTAADLGTITNADNRWAAGSGHSIYVPKKSSTTVYRLTLGDNTKLNQGAPKTWNSFTLPSNAIGVVAVDDAGNVVFEKGSLGTAKHTGLMVIPAGATNVKALVDITLTGVADGRSDNLTVTGDILNGTGYVWFTPNGLKEIYRVTIKNQKQTAVKKYTLPWANQSVSYFYPYSDTEAIYANGRLTNASYEVNIDDAAGAITSKSSISSTAKSIIGMTRKYVGGVLFTAAPTTTATDAAGAISSTDEIVRLTAGDKSYDLHIGATLGNFYQLRTNIVEEDGFVAVYLFSSKGARKYIWAKDNMKTGNDSDGYPIADFTVLPVTGATSYALYQKNGNSWTQIATGATTTLRGQLPEEGKEGNYRIVYSTTGSFSPTENIVCDYTAAGLPIPKEYKAPANLSGRRHSGYCQYELVWNTPENTPSRVQYYNIYRDGALLKQKITFTSYLDPNVAPGQHSYVVEAVYEFTEDAEGNVTSGTITRKSEPIVTPIDPRDHSRIKYDIREIYNFRIGQAKAHLSYPAGKWVGDENNPNTQYIENTTAGHTDNWRQAAHAIVDGKGFWYFLDKNNACIRRVRDTKTALTDPAKFGEYVVKLPTVDQAVAVAVDDAGNLLVRTGNAFYAPLHKAWIIPKGSKAKDATWKEIVFDASAGGAGNRFFDDAYVDKNGTDGQRGRVDFFSVKGNLMSDEVCHIVFAPGQGRSAYCANVQNGKIIKMDRHEVDAEYPNLDVPGAKPIEIGNGTENTAFFRDGDVKNNVFIHQIRSGGYFRISNIHGTAQPGKQPWDDQLILREGQSKQAGGCTVFLRGTHANGVSCSDLFLITGVSSYSVAMGSFTVNRASRRQGYENVPVLDTNSDMFDFTNLIPTATFTQREAAIAAEAANSNSNFLYASVVEEADGNHIYIYQYVPNRRVAKYELVPQIELPVPAITLNSFKVYATDEEGKRNIDITEFKGTMSWKPVDFDSGDKGDYKVMGYNVELVSHSGKKYEIHADSRLTTNEKGELGFSYTVKNPDGTVTNGFKVIDNPDGQYKEGDYVPEFEIPFEIEELGEYNATITADIAPSTDPDKIVKTTPATSKSEVTLEVEDPTVTADVWKGKEGTDVDGKYRVDIDFDHNNNDNENPVSYYEIWVDKKDGKGPQKITVGEDENGFYVVSGGTPGSDDKPTDRIPGTYDFDNDKDYTTPDAAGEGGKKSVITWYPKVNPGEDPSTWDFFVKPVYADPTPHRTVTEGKATVRTGTTGVEVIDGDGNVRLSVYPNPATSVVNVEAADVIDSISIYSLGGGEVRSVKGGDTTTMTVDVDNLAPGVYYLKVNKLPAIKLIKR